MYVRYSLKHIVVSTSWIPNKMRQTVGKSAEIKPGRGVTCTPPLSECNDGPLQAGKHKLMEPLSIRLKLGLCPSSKSGSLLRVTTSRHGSNPTTRPANNLCRHQELEDRWWWWGEAFRLPKPVTDQYRKQGLWNMQGHAESKVGTDSLGYVQQRGCSLGRQQNVL